MTIRYGYGPLMSADGQGVPLATLSLRQRRRCYLCGGKMKKSQTRDHVWPTSRGGRSPGNVALAHQLCNLRKGDRLPYPCELLYRDSLYLPETDLI